MHVDTARSLFAPTGRAAGRPAEPWPVTGGEIQTPRRAVSPFDRLIGMVRRWFA